MKHLFFLFSILLLCAGGFTAAGQVRLVQATRLSVGSSYDSLVRPAVQKKMDRYRNKMAKTVGRVIGNSEMYMESKAPESLLSNFLADQLRIKAGEILGKEVDLSVLNLGGIRAPLPSGTITVGDIYRIMPFENELVLLELRGADLNSILKHIAREGGEGVSGIRMTIRDNAPVAVTIGGAPLDENRVYRVATMDYLANGNSGMVAFGKAVHRIDTRLKVRDVYIDRIEAITAEGKKLTSVLDGRITFQKP